MSRTERREDYKSFIEAGFETASGVYDSAGTHCAIFVRANLSAAGVKPKGKRPKVTAITTWLGVGWFAEPEWIPIEGLDEIIPGDIFYWCGWPGQNVVQWRSAKNGHVGIALEGEGWEWRTAEGGGGEDGSTCRQSDAPKDIRTSHNRPLRGVWRPNNMKAA